MDDDDNGMDKDDDQTDDDILDVIQKALYLSRGATTDLFYVLDLTIVMVVKDGHQGCHRCLNCIT